MEEDEDEQNTSIKGRLLMLVNKIKGQAHKAEEPTEKEQAAPCEKVTVFFWCSKTPMIMWINDNPHYQASDNVDYH